MVKHTCVSQGTVRKAPDELAGQPIVAERIVVPAGRFPGLGAMPRWQIPSTLCALYERGCGPGVAHAEERLRAVAAGGLEQRLPGVTAGMPLLEVDLMARGDDGTVPEWRVSRCHTRHHHYLSRLS